MEGTENLCYKHKSIAAPSWRAVTTLCMISIIVKRLPPFSHITNLQWDMVSHWPQLIHLLNGRPWEDIQLCPHKVVNKMSLLPSSPLPLQVFLLLSVLEELAQPPCYLAVYLISVASWIQTLKSTRSKEERLTDTHAALHACFALN